jgi:hypothetical protein
VLVSSRTTNILLLLVLAVGIGIVAMLSTGVRGGPLDPVSTPGSTDGVRLPGTAISSLPFTINAPGNYYVTRNLTSAGGTGITIASSNVTLDLGGFTLDGANVGQYGVQLDQTAAAKSVVVRNGSVSRWTVWGFDLHTPQEQGVLAENLAANNNNSGIRITRGSLRGCTAMNNTNYGVQAGLSEVSSCVARQNTTGIDASEGTVRDCVTSANTNAGIVSVSSLVEGCTSVGDRWGILAAASNVHHNNVSFSQSDGIRLQAPTGLSTVADNKVNTPGQSVPASGIYVESSNNQVVRNLVTSGVGISVGVNVVGLYNVIDGNSAIQNGSWGFTVTGTNNFILRNIAANNGSHPAEFNFVAGNHMAPVVIGPLNQATVDPWANITNPN